MAGQKKKFGLGAGVSAPRSVIGCRDGCGLWRVDVLNDPEMGHIVKKLCLGVKIA